MCIFSTNVCYTTEHTLSNAATSCIFVMLTCDQIIEFYNHNNNNNNV